MVLVLILHFKIMAVTAFATGTQTAIIGTEHDLTDVNVAGVFTLHVDTSNMVAGDVLELRVYQIELTGGTRRVLFYQPFYGAQLTDDIAKVSFPVGNDLTDATSLRFTLKQTFGTGEVYPWKVLQY